jgi:hypothetical protein
MEIQCPQCEKLYEVDEAQLSGTTTLECHACQHRFQVGANAGPSREDERRWMVRHPETGDVRYLNTFTTLHEWIVEREIDQAWEISRTGETWKTLGRIGEFRPIFQAADNVSSLEADRAVRGPDDSVNDNVRSRLETLDQFDTGGKDAEAASYDRPSPSPASASTSAPSEPRSSRSSDDESRANDGPGELPPSPKASADGGHRVRSESSGRQRDDRRARGQSGDATASNGSDEDVRLETDMFGSSTSGSDASADDDTWSMGDGADLEDEAAPDESWDDDIDYADEFGGPSWGKIVVSLLLLGLIGGGVYMYVFERATLKRLWTSQTGQTQTASTPPSKDAGASSASSGPSPATISSRALHEARRSARDRAETTILSAVNSKASTHLHGAVDEGRTKAKRAGAEAEKADRPASIDTLLAQADQAQSSGESSTSRRLYEQILAREPNNVEALVGLGWSFVDLDESQKAISKFQSALDISPGYGDAYIGLGMAHRKLGRTRKALDAFDTYLSKRPNGPSASIAEYQRKKLRNKLGK